MPGGPKGNVAAALVAVLALVVAVGVARVAGAGADPTPTVSSETPDTEPSVDTDGAAEEPEEPEEEDVSFPAATAAPVGHHGEYAVQYDDLPPETQAQLDVARVLIERYSTGADAIAAGWTPATVNLKGIASHFIRNGAVGFTQFDGEFDLNEPEALLYDGTGPDAPIVGVSYLVAGPEAPEGFEGPWDVWHRHDAVCFAGGLVIAEVGGHPDSLIDISQEECAAQGGYTFPIDNLSMIHVWMKPDYPSESGVFAHDHSDLS